MEPLFCDPPRHLAVAVSGGADSMALVWLIKEWSNTTAGRITALTVDHGLRPGSAEEATQVAKWMAAWDVPHHKLLWRGEKPSTGIQEAARTARYTLMSAWCRENGVDALVLAHHREDQAETFLMRLLRGSGPDGLAAMRPLTSLNGVRIVRPLLDVAKESLVSILQDIGQAWIEDPSNHDAGFTRVKVREWMPGLEAHGIDAGRLGALSGAFGLLRFQLEDMTAEAVGSLVHFDPGGWAEVPRSVIQTAPEILARRMLRSVLKSVGGSGHAPRSGRMARGLQHLRSQDSFKAFSLGGCVVLEKNHKVMILREERRGTPPLKVEAGDRIVWRNRYLCAFGGEETAGRPPYTVAPLSAAGWAQLLQWEPNLRNSGVFHACAATLPALYDGNGLLEIPRFGLRRPSGPEEGKGTNTGSVRFETAHFFPDFEELDARWSL